MKILLHYCIQVGFSTAGFMEIESKMLPEYNHGMVFIVATDDQHHAFSLRCVDGVLVTPVYAEYEFGSGGSGNKPGI